VRLAGRIEDRDRPVTIELSLGEQRLGRFSSAYGRESAESNYVGSQHFETRPASGGRTALSADDAVGVLLEEGIGGKLVGVAASAPEGIAIDVIGKVRIHPVETLNLHHKAVGLLLQYPFCRKTSCNRVLERFLFVE
jgi:hypothetical protein